MKQLFSILLCVITAQVFAQLPQEGVINYKEEIQNPKAKEIRERLAERGIQADIPDVNSRSMQLFFTKNESIYKAPTANEKQEMPRSKKGIMIVRTSAGKDGAQLYQNLEEKQLLQQKKIFGKEFLIVDKLKEVKWKVTGRTEKIGSYQVIEAVHTTEKDTIQAWFTPQIPVGVGPSEYSGLPGAILLVNVNDGERKIYATSFDLRELTKEEQIKQPKKGKKVSQKEFDDIRAKKIEEMKEIYGEKRAKRYID